MRVGQVVTDVPSKGHYRISVESSVGAELVFALHRGPQLSELAAVPFDHENHDFVEGPPKEHHVPPQGCSGVRT